MRFFALLCSLALFTTSAFSFAVPIVGDDDSLSRRASFLPVTGVPGNTYPRYEVRQLQSKHPNQWTLFLLAMQSFQAMPQTQKTSYYQIAGIHGVPRADWDGVGQCSTCTNVDGYCTHDSVLFLGWHRAYLTLFEQQLVVAAKSIAKTYPTSTRAAMQAAASQLRLPYWDWAAHPGSGNTLPSIITNTYVTVNTPRGSKSIRNPLFRHDFTSESGLRYTPFATWQHTLRYPTSDATGASSNINTAVSAFNNIRASLQDQVYQVFSTCTKFSEVAEDQTSSSSSSCANSWEQIHNTVHTTAGGPGDSSKGISGGHMTYLALAAFDPIFWLHHANIDRMFALWQAINPNSYGASQAAPASTWTIAAKTVQNADSPLTPFHRDTAGNFLTTNLVRNTKSLHYTYPEFSDSDGSKAAIVSYVKKLYGPSATGTAGSSKRTASPESLPNSATSASLSSSSLASSSTGESISTLASSSSAIGSSSSLSTSGSTLSASTSSPASPTQTVDPTPLKAGNGSLFQYVANIQTPRYALNGSYFVYLFNGDPSSEIPTSWILDSDLIGPMGVLAQDSMTAHDVLASGSIPLTRTLTSGVTNGTLPNLTEAVVVPYLQAHLEWRIAGPSGLSVDPDSIPNFEVSVYASTSAPPAEDEMPVWSNFVPLAEITQHKAGGATPQSINTTSSST